MANLKAASPWKLTPFFEIFPLKGMIDDPISDNGKRVTKRQIHFMKT
jgi:hypothetical protein